MTVPYHVAQTSCIVRQVCVSKNHFTCMLYAQMIKNMPVIHAIVHAIFALLGYSLAKMHAQKVVIILMQECMWQC